MAIDDNTSYELTGYQVKDLASKIRAKADSSSLASVATSGLYSDLTGAPTIPTVYNGTLTIQQNGTQLGTFSANQSSNETINIVTGGGGASATKFYSSAYSDNANVTLYKDTSLTTHATYQEVIDALQGGGIEWVTIDNSVESVFLPTFYTVDATSFSPDTLIYVTFVKQSNPIVVKWNTTQSNLSSNAVFGTQIGKYTLPTASSSTLGGIKVGSNLSISSGVLSANTMTGATSSADGAAGYVPQPLIADEGKVLHGDGTWKDTTAKLVEMSYGESNAWAKFIAAYNAGSIVYCRASSNSNPASGSQTRKAFMAYVNNATAPTEVEFQYVRSMSSKTDSQQSDQVFIYKLTNASGGTWTVASRNMGPKINVSGPITKTFTTGANATITIGADAMTGATSGAAGTAGIVPAPAAGDEGKFLKGDGTWGIIGETTTTTDGWKKTTLGPNVTIYSQTFSTSGSISGTGQGNTGCTITPPADFPTADDEDVIGESWRDSTAEICYNRLDSLQRTGGCRIYGVSISGARTMNGRYTITLMKRT